MATTSKAASSSDPSNKGGTAYLATQSTFVAIATLLVLIRVYVRTVVVKSIGLDDAVIVLALILSLIVCAMTSLTVHYSALYLAGDYSTKAEALRDVTTALKWSSIAAPIGIFSGLCTRLSICLFLLRIFRTKREWRWGLYAVMVFATAVIIPTIVSLLAQCSPVQKLWDPLLPGSCWSPRTVIDIGYFNGGASVLCDWILATLPIVFMWNVQMRFTVKIGICILMGLGYFTGICAIVRTTLFTDGTSGAEQGGSIQSAVWAILEINVGIIAASIPTLKPLFNPSRPSIFRYFKYRRTSERYRKTSENTLAIDTDDQVQLNKLTLNTMPSAMPSSLSYYQDKGRNHGKGWEDLESRASMSIPEKVHLAERGREMETGSNLEYVGDGEVHAIGEYVV